jgi:hypothetical protein
MLFSVFPFKCIYIEVYVVGDGMPRGQIFIFDHHAALRTIELNEPAIIRIRAEAILLPVDQWGVHFFQGPFGYKAAFLVTFPGADQGVSTALAAPLFIVKIDLQVFSDSNLHGYDTSSRTTLL